MKIKTYKNGITIEGYSNNWINITTILHNQLIQERYLYYTRREALKRFKQKYSIK